MSGAAPARVTLRGTPVVPGVVHAPAVVVPPQPPVEAVRALDGSPFPDEEAALAAYDAAAADVAAALAGRADSLHGDAAEVLAASAGLVRDTGLRAAVARRLRAGDPLPRALSASVDQFAALFSQMGGLMAERVADLRDIERRVRARLVGQPDPPVPAPDVPSVLLAEDLAPADTAQLDPARVLALATERGGPTSHTAAIARQLGIPCVVGVPGLCRVRNGTPVLVDGTSGEVQVAPDAGAAAARVAADRSARAELQRWTGPAVTLDGAHVPLLANVADAASARAAAGWPVEGVGLFRTELCFLNHQQEPTVAEQVAAYAGVFDTFGPDRRVVVRTLDAGSDKPIAFATLDGQGNPALGVRGLRLSFGNPGLMDRQLEAIAAAARKTGTEPWVMAPMVATVAEAVGFAEKVHAHGLRAGAMIEVPASALQAHKLLEVVDFLSVGTNDLAQYTMAADRMAADLAHLTDAWQPAVLALVAISAEAGRRTSRPVGVCGEAAGDPVLAPALVGMGVGSLSMAPIAVPAVGVALSGVTRATCERAAEAALDAPDPMAAREAVRRILAG